MHARRLVLVGVLLLAPVAAARDRAVFVYPRERAWFRRLFYTRHQKELKERVARQYDVDVHEQVATDDALFNIDVRGATVLVITGHGDPFSMYLSGRHRRTLDWTDRARLVAFFSKLDPNATIVLQSCNTAHGFARLIKDAAGPTRRVIAASGAVPRDGLEITSLLPFDVTIHCDDAGRSWDCTFRLP